MYIYSMYITITVTVTGNSTYNNDTNYSSENHSSNKHTYTNNHINNNQRFRMRGASAIETNTRLRRIENRAYFCVFAFLTMSLRLTCVRVNLSYACDAMG